MHPDGSDSSTIGRREGGTEADAESGVGANGAARSSEDGLRELAAQLGGLRADTRRRDALLSRREAQVRDLSLKLAESISLAARERSARELAESQLEQVKGSRLWPLVRRAYAIRAGLKHRAKRMRVRLRGPRRAVR